MELRDLRNFVVLAETLHFGRAAERVALSQPALSASIRRLEDELGGRLFERSRRGVRLAPLGTAVLPRARAAVAAADEAARAAAEALRPDEGTVRLGVIPTVAPFWLPRFLPAYRRRRPGIEVVVVEGTSEDLAPRLLSDEIDLAIGTLPVCHPKMAAEGLFSEPFLFAVPARHPLARKRRIRIAEAEPYPWILLRAMHCARQQVTDFCVRHRARIDTVLETSQVASLLGLVAAGLGVTLVPKMAAVPTKGVVFRPVAPRPPVRTIAVVWRKDRILPPVAVRFREDLKDLKKK